MVSFKDDRKPAAGEVNVREESSDQDDIRYPGTWSQSSSGRSPPSTYGSGGGRASTFLLQLLGLHFLLVLVL